MIKLSKEEFDFFIDGLKRFSNFNLNEINKEGSSIIVKRCVVSNEFTEKMVSIFEFALEMRTISSEQFIVIMKSIIKRNKLDYKNKLINNLKDSSSKLLEAATGAFISLIDKVSDKDKIIKDVRFLIIDNRFKYEQKKSWAEVLLRYFPKKTFFKVNKTFESNLVCNYEIEILTKEANGIMNGYDLGRTLYQEEIFRTNHSNFLIDNLICFFGDGKEMSATQCLMILSTK